MRLKKPMKQILIATRSVWDRPETRPAVRENFDKLTKCGTLSLGAEIFASQNQERLVPHTCKARPCPSCGNRNGIQWQREQWCALPDGPYVGMVFTMPDILWPLFRENRHLLHDLPELGARVIEQWAKLKYGVRLMIMVIPQTFGGRLNFNPHLHILVSGGGLREAEGRWITPLAFEKDKLMHMWRHAVVTHLRNAVRAKELVSDFSDEELKSILTAQYERWWSIYIDHFASKEHFLRYGGRYIRRSPIPEYRIVKITDSEVHFWIKDKRLKRRVTIRCSLEEFVTALAEHVPDRYKHSIRYFGLLAPGSKAQLSVGLFALLGQQKRPRPRRLGWRFLLRRDFGVDPLVDRFGQEMQRVGRLPPVHDGVIDCQQVT